MNNRISTSFSNSMYNQEMRPLDYLYGPWDSLDDLLLELHVSVDDIEPGLTIGINEGNSIVEYWNPIKGKGFIKKSNGISASYETYLQAIETATSDNIGNIIFIKNTSKDTDGKEHQSGMYVISGDGELKLIGSNIEYGEFPEGLDMSDDAYDPDIVSKDGAAKVSDVYKRLKNHMTKSNSRITPIETFKNNLLSQIDNYTPHDIDNGDKNDDTRDNHMYIQRVERDESGQVIILKRKALDTDRILMCGDNQDENGNIIGDGTFLTVRGVSIGDYKPGDVIKNGTSLEEVLRKLLDKTIYPDYNKNVKPSINLNIENNQTYEVGNNLNMNFNPEFVDGKVATFLNDTDIEETLVNAGCTTNGDITLKMLKPGDEEYSDIDLTNLIEGTYKIKAEVKYTSSIVVPQTNKGEDVTDLEKYIIQAGTVSVEKYFNVKYKMWNYIGEKYDALLGETITDINNFTESWFDEDNSTKSITIENNQGIYFIVPKNYKVVFDTQFVQNADAVEGGTYEYTLPNNDTKTYKIYYMLNAGTYENIRYVKLNSSENTQLESGTILWSETFGEHGDNSIVFNNITTTVDEYTNYKSQNHPYCGTILYDIFDRNNLKYIGNDNVKIVF